MPFLRGRAQLVESLPDLLLAADIIDQFGLSPAHVELADVVMVW